MNDLCSPLADGVRFRILFSPADEKTNDRRPLT
jgi:hypothetical protein